MTRSTLLIFIALVAALALVIGVTLWLRSGDEAPVEPEPETAIETLSPEEVEDVPIYFPGRDHRLYGEDRTFARSSTPSERLEQLVEAVLSGPSTSDLIAPMPAGVRLLGVHLNAEGVAYVDLTMEEPAATPSWGSKREMLAAYSLVNTILYNLPEATSVVMLWNGAQRPTFAGHLDTRRALTPHRGLMADPPE